MRPSSARAQSASQAGPSANDDIRRRVDEESLRLERTDRGLMDRLMFWREPEPPGTQRHLRRRLLAADIEHRKLLRQMGQRLQQQRRFADTGIATDQHHRARHQTAAEHTIELVGAGGMARHLGSDHGIEPLYAGTGCKRRETVTRNRRTRRLDHGFLQGIPGAAMRALAGPARRCAAAFAADMMTANLGHEASVVSERDCR